MLSFAPAALVYSLAVSSAVAGTCPAAPPLLHALAGDGDVVRIRVHQVYKVGKDRFMVSRVQRVYDGCLEVGDAVTVMVGSACPVSLGVGAQYVVSGAAMPVAGALYLALNSDSYFSPFDALTGSEQALLGAVSSDCCVPDCDGETCGGEDGCGGTCGCPEPLTCNAEAGVCTTGFPCSPGQKLCAGDYLLVCGFPAKVWEDCGVTGGTCAGANPYVPFCTDACSCEVQGAECGSFYEADNSPAGIGVICSSYCGACEPGEYCGTDHQCHAEADPCMGLGETKGCCDDHTMITCENNQLVEEVCPPVVGCGYNSWFGFAQCGGSLKLPSCAEVLGSP